MAYSVLIVDDLPVQANMIRQWLEEYRQVRPDLFANIDGFDVQFEIEPVERQLEESLASAGRYCPYGIIIADVLMPDPGKPLAPASPAHGAFRLYQLLKRMRESAVARDGRTALHAFPKLLMMSARPQDLGELSWKLNDEQLSLGADRWQWYFPKSEDLGDDDQTGLMRHTTWIRILSALVTSANAANWLEHQVDSALWQSVSFSARMQETQYQLRRYADHRRYPIVCVVGESGSGKDRAAEVLHQISGREGKVVCEPLTALKDNDDPAAFLFGWKRGAFTGAETDHVGLLERANNGTLFLDEARAPVMRRVQDLLLKVTEIEPERRRFTPLRGAPVTFTGQIVLAASDLRTYLDNEAPVDIKGRVADAIVEIPPLRERREEIRPIAQRLFAHHWSSTEAGGLKGAVAPALDDELLAALERYRWPGNLRELTRCMEYLAGNCVSRRVSIAALQRHPQWQAIAACASAQGLDEVVVVRRALTKHGGNYARAAADLDVDPSTMSRKVRSLGLDAEFPSRGPGRPRRRR